MRGILGELPNDIGNDEQAMPYGDTDGGIVNRSRNAQNAGNVANGAPDKNVHTVSVFDARPPLCNDFTIDSTFERVYEDQTEWTDAATFTVPGGKIALLRKVSIAIFEAHDNIDLNTPWRVLVNNSPVNGNDNIILNPLSNITDFNCYILCQANGEIKIQKLNVGTTDNHDYSVIQVRMYLNMLEPQNVTLPWEPCNVE